MGEQQLGLEPMRGLLGVVGVLLVIPPIQSVRSFRSGLLQVLAVVLLVAVLLGLRLGRGHAPLLLAARVPRGLPPAYSLLLAAHP